MSYPILIPFNIIFTQRTNQIFPGEMGEIQGVSIDFSSPIHPRQVSSLFADFSPGTWPFSPSFLDL